MNRRFKIKIDYDEDEDKKLILKLQVPYKNIFGKIKYTYNKVLNRYPGDLPSDVVTQKQIEEYMVTQFENVRHNTKRNRVIERMKYKK